MAHRPPLGRAKFILRPVIVSASNGATLTMLATLGRSGAQDLASGTADVEMGVEHASAGPLWLRRIGFRGLDRGYHDRENAATSSGRDHGG